jgi:hypothetical protein
LDEKWGGVLKDNGILKGENYDTWKVGACYRIITSHVDSCTKLEGQGLVKIMAL